MTAAMRYLYLQVVRGRVRPPVPPRDPRKQALRPRPRPHQDQVPPHDHRGVRAGAGAVGDTHRQVCASAIVISGIFIYFRFLLCKQQGYLFII